MTVTTKRSHRGDHVISRKAIAQGMSACSPLHLYARVHLFVAQARHTRPRVQRAPGIPCSLRFEEGQRTGKTRANHVAGTSTHTHSSSSGLTGRASIPKAVVIEPRSRGVLDPRMRGDDD